MIINNDDNNSNEEEENDSFNNNNIKLRGGKRMLEISNSNIENNLLKKETPKILYVNKNPSELEDYKKKTKVEYESAPINLNYKEDITKNNTSSGWNDMFEVYISYQNNNAYLASPNRKSYNIDIFLLEENRKETSLKGHKNNIRTIRYFLNKDKKENQKEENKELIQEYLISADDNKIVIVWDVLNQFEIKQLIDTNYEDDIYSCALFFNKNTERNYIVTSTYNTSSDISNSATKLYSLATGEYGYYIKESNFDNIYYLLIWLNPKDQQNYLIQFSFKKIVINNLEKGKDEIYAKLIHEPENEHYSGYLFSNENSEFLCTTSYNGFIHVWNLYTKKLSNIIDTKIILCHIIQWNEKFAIAADFENKSFVIIDLDEKKIFKGKQIEHKMEVKCVKKIMHSELGECLITAGRDHTIKLWAL
jgi:WD40 repeat protein